MYSEYPIIKIPVLISNAQLKAVEIERISAIEITRKLTIAKYFRQAGYGFLFIGALIFTLATISSVNLLTYSVISLLLGIVAISGTSLMDTQQRSNRTIGDKSTHRISEFVTGATIDWSALLAGKVMPYGAITTAHVGVSEKYFMDFLAQYFGDVLHPGYEFQISHKYSYSSDFTLILSNGISLIIEIDEPYDGRSKQPHHCIDDSKDDTRDAFFLSGNWVVIRFSEFQVCAYPRECCYTIARTIDSIDQQTKFSKAFRRVMKLPRDQRWNTQQAIVMAEQGYRREYLEKYGVWKQPDNEPQTPIILKKVVETPNQKANGNGEKAGDLTLPDDIFDESAW